VLRVSGQSCAGSRTSSFCRELQLGSAPSTVRSAAGLGFRQPQPSGGGWEAAVAAPEAGALPILSVFNISFLSTLVRHVRRAGGTCCRGKDRASPLVIPKG